MSEEQKNDIVKNNDEKSDEKSETEVKTDSQLLAEQVESLRSMVHKGYTSQAQEIAELKNNLSAVAEGMNKKSGSEEGDDDYVTVGKLKSFVGEISALQEKREAQKEQMASDTQKYIDNIFEDLKMQGVISNDEEKRELAKLAFDKSNELGRVIDPREAASFYREIKAARNNSNKEKEEAKKKAKQEEGGKIGSSAKNTSENVGVVNWSEIQKERW